MRPLHCLALWPLLHVIASEPECSVDTSNVSAARIQVACGAQVCKATGVNCQPSVATPQRTLTYSLEDAPGRRFDGEIMFISHNPLSADRSTNYGYKGEMLRDAQVLFFEWLADRGGLRVQGKNYSMGVMWVDDEVDKQQAARALRYGAERTGSRLALGGYGSALAKLSAKEARATGMFMITAGASNTETFAADTSGHPTVFTLLPNGNSYNLALIQAVADNARALDDGITAMPEGASCGETTCWDSLKMSVLAVGPNCDPSIIDYGNQVLGSDKMGLQDYLPADVSDADIKAALARYKADKTTVIFVCSKDYRHMIRVVYLLEMLDYTLFAVIAKGMAQAGAYRDRVSAGWWQGSYVLDSTTWDSYSKVRGEFSNMTSQDFTTLYSAKFDREPSYLAAAQFAALCTVTKAIQDIDSLDPQLVANRVAQSNLSEFYAQVKFTSYGQVDFMPRVTQVPEPFQRWDPRYRDYFRFKTIWPHSAGVDAVFPTPTWAFRRCSWERTSPKGVVCYGNGYCSTEGACVCQRGWQGESCEIEIPEEDQEMVVIIVLVCALVPAFGFGVFTAWLWRKRAQRRWEQREQEALALLEASLWEQVDDKMSQAMRLLAKLGYSPKLLEEAAKKLRRHQSETAGVSVAYLLSDEFTHLARSRTGLEDPTFYDMKDKFFFGGNPIGKDKNCPRDGKPGCALVDTLKAKHRRQCTHFLSWTWGYKLSTVQDGLRQWIKREHLKPSEQFLYMCFFVNNQYRLLVEKSEAGTDELQQAFEGNLKRIGRLVALLDTWDNPRYLTRIWTIFEQFVAIKSGVPVTMLLTSRAAEDVIAQFDKGRAGISKVMEAMSRVHSEKAEAHLKRDEIAVKELLLKEFTFDYVDEQIVEFMLRWMATTFEEHMKKMLAKDTMELTTSLMAARTSSGDLTGRACSEDMTGRSRSGDLIRDTKSGGSSRASNRRVNFAMDRTDSEEPEPEEEEDDREAVAGAQNEGVSATADQQPCLATLLTHRNPEGVKSPSTSPMQMCL
eukprot:TRINITY_DN20420_c0_g1_i1.p1 TRINITY_DN20420_c0_g1~~TRINITY_DN20420_c0_g1_i1.p1  ORF type:complete len:1012 (+),score=208.73 TRINITY_DN20420_c0_g1_i1:173-3208(+)